MKRNACPVLAIIMAAIALAGCQTNELPLHETYAQIQPGATQATAVLDMIGPDRTLHTTDAVSTLKQQNHATELLIVRFDQADDQVHRKDYIQHRSRMGATLFTREQLGVDIATVLPRELLDEPYETAARRDLAIVRFAREALVEDAQPFTEDQQTLRLVGMARSAFQEAIIALDQDPRNAANLANEDGFAFTHTVFGKSRLKVEPLDNQTYRLQLVAADWVDAWNNW